MIAIGKQIHKNTFQIAIHFAEDIPATSMIYFNVLKMSSDNNSSFDFEKKKQYSINSYL